MVVASGTGDGKCLECLSDRIDLAIDDCDFFAFDIDRCLVEFDESEEGQSDEAFVPLLMWV